MISGTSSSKFIFTKSLPEGTNKVILSWLVKEAKVAEVEIDLIERSLKFLSITFSEDNLWLAPSLTRHVIRQIKRTIHFEGEEKLSRMEQVVRNTLEHHVKDQRELFIQKKELFVRKIFDNQTAPAVAKELLIEWFKNGGDPYIRLNLKGQVIRSLVTLAFNYQDTEIIEAYLECRGDPYCVVAYVSKTPKQESELPLWTLPQVAVLYNRADILKLLIQKKVRVDFEMSGSTPLSLAISNHNVQMVSILLKEGRADINGLCGSTSLSPLMQALMDEGWAGKMRMVELLLSCRPHCSEHNFQHLLLHYQDKNTTDAIKELAALFEPLNTHFGFTEEQIDLFLRVICKGLNQRYEYPLKILEHVSVFKNLGHTFGIPLKTALVGSNLYFQTEGSNQVRFKNYIKMSVMAFLKKFPEFYTASTLLLLESFCDTRPLKEKASFLIEAARTQSTVFFDGTWPDHYVTLGFVRGKLCVANRGVYQEEGAQPGLHFYDLDHPEQLTEELLLELTSNPTLLLTPEGKGRLGLSLKPCTTIAYREQPGGFCAWTSTKLGLRLLFALANGSLTGDQNPMETLKGDLVKTHKLYKCWSAFDRDLTLERAIQFYEGNPFIRPPVTLLLFVLANHKGSCEPLTSFLLKQKLSLDDFNVLDNKGQSIFGHLCRKENFLALKTVAGEHWEWVMLRFGPNLKVDHDWILRMQKRGRRDLVSAMLEEQCLCRMDKMQREQGAEVPFIDNISLLKSDSAVWQHPSLALIIKKHSWGYYRKIAEWKLVKWYLNASENQAAMPAVKGNLAAWLHAYTFYATVTHGYSKVTINRLLNTYERMMEFETQPETQLVYTRHLYSILKSAGWQNPEGRELNYYLKALVEQCRPFKESQEIVRIDPQDFRNTFGLNLPNNVLFIQWQLWAKGLALPLFEEKPSRSLDLWGKRAAKAYLDFRKQWVAGLMLKNERTPLLLHDALWSIAHNLQKRFPRNEKEGERSWADRLQELSLQTQERLARFWLLGEGELTPFSEVDLPILDEVIPSVIDLYRHDLHPTKEEKWIQSMKSTTDTVFVCKEGEILSCHSAFIAPHFPHLPWQVGQKMEFDCPSLSKRALIFALSSMGYCNYEPMRIMLSNSLYLGRLEKDELVEIIRFVKQFSQRSLSNEFKEMLMTQFSKKVVEEIDSRLEEVLLTESKKISVID